MRTSQHAMVCLAFLCLVHGFFMAFVDKLDLEGREGVHGGVVWLVEAGVLPSPHCRHSPTLPTYPKRK